jgi:hypothetical protein
MALSIQNDNSGNFKMVNGVFVGQAAPLLLGLKDLSCELPLSTGKIVIGFDPRISPAQFRLFYDPGESIIVGTEPTKGYGLVMTSQICFDGLPILPSVFSKAIAYKDDYSNFPTLKLNRKICPTPAYNIDMLSADRLKDNNPYYPYNSLKLDQVNTLTNAGGFMAVKSYDVEQDEWIYSNAANTPLCASILAPIGIDIDAPSQSILDSIINKSVEDEIVPVVSCDITPDDINNGTVINKILTALVLNVSDIVKIQAIGSSFFITVNDSEGYYPRLFAQVLTDTRKVNVYALENNEVNAFRFNTSSSLFERFIDFSVGINGDGFPSRVGPYLRSYTKNGDKLLNTLLSGKEHWISSTYKIYCVGRGQIKNSDESLRPVYTCMGGVEFSVKRMFNKETLNFDEIQIATPKEMSGHDVINYNLELHNLDTASRGLKKPYGPKLPELVNYLEAYSRKKPGSPNQSQWFNNPLALPPTFTPNADDTKNTYTTAFTDF